MVKKPTDMERFSHKISKKFELPDLGSILDVLGLILGTSQRETRVLAS